MPDSVERNRLRYAGRIPQETLDYLASKRRWDSRLRWWELPIFLVVAASIVLLAVLLFRSRESLFSLHSFTICVLILSLSNTLRTRFRN